MSAVFLFIVLAAGLTLVALVMLLRPWWHSSAAKAMCDPRSPDEYPPVSLDVYRNQLQELMRDRDAGVLAAENFAQAQEELRRRLLEEVKAFAPSEVLPHRLVRHSALALVVGIPLAAVLIYMQIGNPQALIPPQIAVQRRVQEVDAMLARLVERLKASPDDTRGWLTLARAYKALGRFAEAAEAFEKARVLIEGDPALLADYAYALIQAAGGSVSPRAEALLDAALRLDPKQPQALFMAGLAANDHGDFATAVARWERLLPLLEPGSEEAAILEEALDRARGHAEALMTAPGNTPRPLGKTPGKPALQVPAKDQGISSKKLRRNGP